MPVEFLELTPRGRGAISVVAVRGESARVCINECFSPASGKPFLRLSNRSIVYGNWNSTGEDLIVVQLGDDSFEVQCHGSLAAVASIKSDLESHGASEADSADAWTTAINEYQAEIAKAMEACQTQRTAKHLLQQYELWGNPDLSDPNVVETALSFAKFGEKLTSPWRVVLCGRPNVGKSSLINAISGFERAIVHDMAGTTRDLVSQHTAIDGWPVELIDSAGIRESEDQIEQAGVSKANEMIASADLVIHVVDASDGSIYEPEISQHRAGLVVVNKIDLCESPDIPEVECPCVQVSATTGEGVNDLLTLVSKTLVPIGPTSTQLIPVTPHHIECLKEIAL